MQFSDLATVPETYTQYTEIKGKVVSHEHLINIYGNEIDWLKVYISLP